MSREDRANPANVKLLRVAYNELLDAQAKAIDAVVTDGKGDDPYEVFAPLPSGQHGREARLALARSIKDVFDIPQNKRAKLESGLICASPVTVAAIERLNIAKESLKSTVSQIKGTDDPDNGSLGYRPVELQRTMKEVGFAAADLKRVYAKIRILEPGVHRVSWTWLVNHGTYKPIPRDVLERRLAGLEKEDPAAAALARSRLDAVEKPRPVTFFTLPDQLRVNYSTGAKGSRTNKSAAVSGVLVVPQKSLPIIKWVDRDLHQTRKRTRRPEPVARRELLPGWGVFYDASSPR
ncbi:hypothetical protein DOK_12026 [gamma proteobacterium BDW918]|nr:hypothetical protein DOK_12026 [gamma proteobacterium BDW918]